MSSKLILTAVSLDEESMLSFSEVCAQYQIPEDLLKEMIAYGLFDVTDEPQKRELFNQQDLARLEKACRLHTDLDVNLAGVALVLELLDKLERLHEELAILRQHFK